MADHFPIGIYSVPEIDRNPFEQLGAIDDIRMRVKKGCLLK
jgi:hypothetical protein